jgi:hypothetical protein
MKNEAGLKVKMLLISGSTLNFAGILFFAFA